MGVLAFLAIRNEGSELENQVSNYLTKIYDNISEQEQMDIVNTLQKNVSKPLLLMYFGCCNIDIISTEE